ncbi:MAG TPA: hypothetical protein VKQ28_01290 [Candidatus Acidoferrum sp.]|nr:hypothetical protein [Candidatus Acidoferrum sp.]
MAGLCEAVLAGERLGPLLVHPFSAALRLAEGEVAAIKGGEK